MLIVKDFSKLEEHGFEKKDLSEGLWVKKVEPRDRNTKDGEFEWIVNPVSDNCAINELLLYVYADTSDKHGRAEVDVLLDCDDVFEMLIDGTIKYVPREVVEYGNDGTDSRAS